MQLEQLLLWRLEGSPDVFMEVREGQTWQVIHSGGKAHHAGFYQVVDFERPVDQLEVGCLASLYTDGGGLMVRVGIDPQGGTAPTWGTVCWSGWHGPDNGWSGEPPKQLGLRWGGPATRAVTVFLESRARWPVRANTSRWRDARLEFRYAEAPDPEPDPDPVPDPEPEPGEPGELATLREAMALAGRLLDQAGAIRAEVAAVLERFGVTLHSAEEWARAQAWVEDYNQGRGEEG